MILLGVVVVIVHVDAEFHFLDYDHFLVLFSFALALFLLVNILAEIHDAAYRRHCGRGNFHQIEVLFLRLFDGVVGRHDAQLVALVVNHADFTHADAVIRADKTLIDTSLRRALRYLQSIACVRFKDSRFRLILYWIRLALELFVVFH